VYIEHLTLGVPTHRVEWPLLAGGRPPLRADAYVERPHLHRQLVFTPGSTIVVTQVVTGDGGVGKTQLAAAAYADARSQKVDLAVWVNASSRPAVLGTFASAYAAVTGRSAAHGDAANEAVKFLQWLEITDRSWFIVLDDLGDPADLSGLWPQGHGGQVVV
jgi:hypothetical protein